MDKYLGIGFAVLCLILAIVISSIYGSTATFKNKYNPKLSFLVWAFFLLISPIVVNILTLKGIITLSPVTAQGLTVVSKVGLIVLIIWASVAQKIRWYWAISLLLINYFLPLGTWLTIILILLVNRTPKYCHKCHKVYSAESNFCEDCGAKLIADVNICSKCKQEYSAEKTFCPVCGEKLVKKNKYEEQLLETNNEAKKNELNHEAEVSPAKQSRKCPNCGCLVDTETTFKCPECNTAFWQSKEKFDEYIKAHRSPLA